MFADVAFSCHCCWLVSKIYKMFGFVLGMKREHGSFILVILVGLAMVVGVLDKIIFSADIDSDWFWFLAGMGLVVEGVISLRRQRKFDKKFKVARKGD